MRINGTDITSLVSDSIQFLDYTLPPPSFTRQVTISDGDTKIVNKRETLGINNIQVRLVMYADKDDSYIMASKLVSLLGEAYVDFYGDLVYRVTIATDGGLELLSEEMFLYTMQLQVLEKLGDEVEIITTSANPIVLPNVGTYKTPILIEVTPTTSIASFSVYGFGAHTSATPLVVNLPVINKKTIIDGVDKQILQEVSAGVYENKFASTNLISFPVIPSGGTTLTFSPTNLNITIRYNPRYI